MMASPSKKSYELSCGSLEEVDKQLKKLRNRREGGEESFEQEFNLIESKTSDMYFRDFISSMKNDNIKKNRYSNVLATERTRVKLVNTPDSNDYINANYINGEIPGSEKAYIATQGPLEETALDFWIMVWNEKAVVIVMLTRLIENDRVKCYRYWPKEGSMTLHNRFRITNVHTSKGKIIVKRRLRLENLETNESRDILHLQYKEWPDHGLPASTTNFRQLLHIVDRVMPTLSAPVIVHCSAGIGRTGTFCAVHSSIARIENQYKNHQAMTCNIQQTVLRLREERAGMVQTKEQYIFCYMAVLEELLERYRAGNVAVPVNHPEDENGDIREPRNDLKSSSINVNLLSRKHSSNNSADFNGNNHTIDNSTPSSLCI